jgi:hypothetical protein
MKLKTGDMVYVEWVDSESYGSWEKGDVMEANDLICQSCSFVVRVYDNAIVLAGSRDPANDNWADFMKIPRVAITKIKKLKVS